MSFQYRTIVFSLVCGMFVFSAARAAETSVQDSIKALQSADEAAKIAAIDQLAAQGDKAAEAAEPLLKLLADSSPAVRTHAVKALAAIRPGPKVMVPLFIKVMEDSDPAAQMRILHAIADTGEAAVPGLVRALENDKVPYWACIVLREIGPAAKDAVPALTKAIKHPRADVRREAVLALGAIGDAAKPAVPQIAETLGDEHVRSAATFVLAQLGKIPADAETKIRANAKSDDKNLATISLWALAKAHPDDQALRREATEQIVASLKDQDPFVRVSAARALAALPPAPEITLPILEKALKEADADTAQYMLDALATMGPKALPRLIELLKHKTLRVQVVYVLGAIGPAAAPAVEELTKLIGDKDDQLATETILALGKIGPEAKAAVPALVKAMEQEQCPNAHAIIFALGRIGPNAVTAEPQLLKAMKSKDQSLAVVAAWAVTKVSKSNQAAVAVPVLVAGLSDTLPETRIAAAEGLSDLGPAARAAAPALKKAASDERKAVRDAAAKALQAVEKK
jgi:HEAT repeat protein